MDGEAFPYYQETESLLDMIRLGRMDSRPVLPVWVLNAESE